MKQLLAILAAVFVGFSAQAVDRITATITVTNPPVTGNSITINSGVRYWTNASTASTIQTNLVGKNESATNLYEQIADNPYSGGVILRWSTTNTIQLIGPLGGALAGSLSGNWGTLTLSTQSGPGTYTAIYPFENITGTTNRTNQASSFVSGISAYSTNAFTTNAAAMSNFLTKGASPQQTISGPVQLSGTVGISQGNITNALLINATNNGIIGSITNGYWTNGTASKLTVTNLSAPGTGLFSERLGTNTTASGDFSLAIGALASASAEGATAIGYATVANKLGSTALGNVAEALGTNATAIGYGANAAYSNSVAIGANSSATAHFQIRLGSSTHKISAPGLYDGPTSTNSTLLGTNIFAGRLDAPTRANTTLANGYNSAVILGTNLVIEFSGPSGAYTNAGFAAPGGPQLVWASFDNPGLSFTLLNESGLEATAANRITTDTGGLLNSTNRTVHACFRYDTTTSRWRVLSFR